MTFTTLSIECSNVRMFVMASFADQRSRVGGKSDTIDRHDMILTPLSDLHYLSLYDIVDTATHFGGEDSVR